MDCGHDHSSHAHDHSHEDDEGYSLHDAIDKTHVWCLNEETRNSGREVLKAHEDRLTLSPSLRSQEVDDDDEEPELLLHVPFTEAVSIKSISIRGVSSGTTAGPKSVKIFVDRDDMDFESAQEMTPTLKMDLLHPEHDEGTSTIDYPLRPAGRFQNISSATLYFCDNFGGTETYQTEISFVGFKGKATKMKRRAVETVYETKGMLKDHKVPNDALGTTKNLF